jgi:type IV pilus assembly protein PilB
MPTSTKHRARLGDLLVARGVITGEQLAAALDSQQRLQQQRLIGEILVDQGYATKEQVLSAVAEACGVPFARLTPQLMDAAARPAIPEAFIQKHGVLPLFKVRDVLTVAMAEPSNLFLVDEIAHAAGLSVQIVAATSDNIYQMIEYAFAESREEAEAREGAADPAAGEVLLSDDYDTVYGAWSPERVAGLLVREAVRSRASAIHIEPDEKVLRIRFCIDGVLHVVMRPPARLAPGLTGAFDEMMGFSNHPSSGHERHRSARLLVQGRAVQLHMAGLTGAFGPRVVVRLVRDDEAQKPLEKLGFDFEVLARLRELLAPMRGLVLVAGPRAAGATTTLYSTLNALDPIRLNICTYESTINFNLPGVSQFSPATCGTADAGAALERLLTQQPDVLALDCGLTGAVAAAAVEAARDGCLVLAHVRAADAAEAIVRFSAFAPPQCGAADGPAAVLRAVLAQRLVRTICPNCRASHEPPAAIRRRIAEVFAPVEEYVKGRGCANCGRTGLVGRIGLFELVPADADLADLVRRGADAGDLRAAIRASGHPSLWVDGINKVRAGITSLDEVVAVLAGCPGDVLSAAAETAAARRTS